jgi:hypothetical protein
MDHDELVFWYVGRLYNSSSSSSSSFFFVEIINQYLFYSSPESVNRSNNSIQMPSSELSFDAYRFRRLNNQDSGPTRPRNIAKVEPYSMNTNTMRPLYQSSQPITEPTVVPSLKARSHLNSMGNTPINSSTSSSAGSLRHSDFLISNSAYSKPYPYPHPQPTSASSSYPIPPILLSESLSHGSLHQLPAANIPSYNGHATGLPSLKNNSQDKYHSQSSMVRIINERIPDRIRLVFSP